MFTPATIDHALNQSTRPRMVIFIGKAIATIRLALSNLSIALLHRLGLSKRLVSWLHKVAADGFNGIVDYRHSEVAYRLILNLTANDRVATIKLGQLYMNQGRLKQAIHILTDWLARFPDDVDVHITVSRLCSEMSETENAKDHLEVASRLAPKSTDVLEGFGFFHRWNGDLDESSEFLRSALKDKEKPSTLCLLAQNLIDEGERPEAVRLLEQALRLEPDFLAPYILLASCGHYRDFSHSHILYMQRRLEERNLPLIIRSGFHFALGKSFEKHGLWDEAFTQFKAGNDISWGWFKFHFRIQKWVDYIGQKITFFDSNFFETMRPVGHEQLGGSLIFIVGMPRSGSTLVEQILASHPDVRAGGERHDLWILIDQLCSEWNEPYPLCVRRLDHEAISNLGRRYLERLSELFGGYSRLVDKNLYNYLEIGLLTTLFPKAKVIHCQRDALDTCVSCYCSNLLACQFAHDLRTLGLMWHSIMPGRILDVRYEALVNDPDNQIRRLLSHCTLPWHPECLSPHATRRPVNTASATQVKSPIHSRSIGRWKNYEKHLGPLMAALSGS
jgi:tetratricopeptide (TPR) repeat protein